VWDEGRTKVAVVADWRRGQLGWAATLPSLLLLLEEGSRAGNNQKEEENA
jgi:hypothetical protein